MREPTVDECIETGQVVLYEAMDRFDAVGHVDDYCIQFIAEEYIVFGDTNRVIWKPGNGFKPDRSYCTEGFLKEWDSRYGK